MGDDIDLSGTRLDPRNRAGAPAAAGTPAAPAGERRRRHWWLIGGGVALVLVVVWIVRNRRTVRVDWLFGSTDAALALVILVAAALGWALGLATAAIWRRRRARNTG